eukprot:CAMPEP_0194754394 /NCGR_PEP_ID=MMETSP0323_2-20130528/8375_1 /TAXON_ID=2866 ORGANISM="Crypthecodinium cohnii, Strain Seligo" /NCGR_SAMPLE_ID=MMETSP0323_2 /ASSEMBLY_ACC=CAM_ASM_000346 /LENGTH=31 /DNA_ID= /DNA_START= /DNA_END= /DNA_ORIENTATION=
MPNNRWHLSGGRVTSATFSSSQFDGNSLQSA